MSGLKANYLDSAQPRFFFLCHAQLMAFFLNLRRLAADIAWDSEFIASVKRPLDEG